MSSKDLVPVNIEQYGHHYNDRSFFSKLKKAALKAGRKEAAGAVEELVEGAKGFLEGLGGDKDE